MQQFGDALGGGGLVAPGQTAAGDGVVQQFLAGVGAHVQGAHQVQAGVNELLGANVALAAQAADDGLDAGGG